MSIKKLTRAAQAAGYAMAHSDDLLTPTLGARGSQQDSPVALHRAQDDRSRAAREATSTSYTEAAQQWFGAFVGKAAT